MKKIILVLSITLIVVGCATNNNDLVIVKNNESKYHIILPKQPTNNEQFAANLLQQYFYQCYGAKVPIVSECKFKHKREICIGKTNRYSTACEKDNTISIKKDNKRLIFYCQDDKYTMYSVIEFLKKYMGVEMYASNCITYRKDSSLILNDFANYEYTTPNTFRQVNSVFNLQDTVLCKWLRNDLYQDLFAAGYFVHTSNKLLSPMEYYDTHPEYFALVNNERRREEVCYSNEEVYKIMKDNLLKAMILQPDKQWWSISQNDNDVYCQCEKCTALMKEYGSKGAPGFLLVNKMAKEFKDKQIFTLAYTYSRKAPVNINFEPNVNIMLCSIEENRNKPIELSQSEFVTDLYQWSKLTNNIFLWDYDVDFAYYTSPFPNLHVLQPNIQLFTNNGASMHFQQANSNTGHEFAPLKNFVLSQLLWNPSLNIDSLIENFSKAYFGPASNYILEYIKDIEAQAIKYSDSISLGIYNAPTTYKDNILSKQNMDRFEEYFNKAEAIVANDSTYLLRVKTERLSLDYAIMEIGKTLPFSDRGWFEVKDDGKYTVRQEMLDRFNRFKDVCNAVSVIDLNEGGLTPMEYNISTQHFLQSDFEHNIALNKKIISEPQPSKMYSSGDLATLTNGVKGSDDYKMNWIGWWGEDIILKIDLDTLVENKTITISTLDNWRAWILHPLEVECLVSSNDSSYTSLNTIQGWGNKKNNPAIKEFTFNSKNNKFRYVMFKITATKTLPSWHHSYDNPSWVFIDEITVN